MQQEDDAGLAAGLLAGIPAAFDRFVDVYHTRLFQYAFLMCGQRDDAEEVSQDTLLQVFQTIGQLRDPERLKAWVFRIAKNACLMKRRKSVFAPSRVLSLEELGPNRMDGSQHIEIADWSNLPDSEMFRIELRENLNRAITDLPEIYRAVLLLRDVEGLSTADTAEVLGENEAVIKQRLHRARLAVRASLDSYVRTREYQDGKRTFA